MTATFSQKAVASAEAEGDTPTIEAFLQSVLSGQNTAEEAQLEAFRILRTAGRDADLIRIVSLNPKILEFAGTLEWAVLAAAGSGWPELVDQLKLFAATAQNPERFIPEIGAPLLRCAYQLVQRGQVSDGMRRFISLSAQRTLFSDDGAMDPMLLDMMAQIFGTAEARSQIKAIAATRGIEPPAWIEATLARRDPTGLAEIIGGMAGTDRGDYFPESRVLSTCGSGGARESLTALDAEAAATAGLTLPDLTVEALTEGVQQAYALSGKLAPEVLAPYRQALSETNSDFSAPVLVLSTGRAGTRSINALLMESEGYAPFHFYNFHQEPGDLNRLFHAMLRGEVHEAALRPALERLVRYRAMEICWSSLQSRRPVLVNHLDMVQAPLYLALFPDMDVVHIHRDPAKTLMSHAYKRQFRYQQIRPLYGREDAKSGQFLSARPSGLDLEQTVTWFMTATELAAEAVSKLAGPDHYHDLDMDRVFKGEPEALTAFQTAFPDPRHDQSHLAAHFSVPINEKSHYTIPDAFKDPERARGLYEGYRAELMETGRLV